MVWIIGLALVAFIVVQAIQGAWLLAAVTAAAMVWVLVYA